MSVCGPSCVVFGRSSQAFLDLHAEGSRCATCSYPQFQRTITKSALCNKFVTHLLFRVRQLRLQRCFSGRHVHPRLSKQPHASPAVGTLVGPVAPPKADEPTETSHLTSSVRMIQAIYVFTIVHLFFLLLFFVQPICGFLDSLHHNQYPLRVPSPAVSSPHRPHVGRTPPTRSCWPSPPRRPRKPRATPLDMSVDVSTGSAGGAGGGSVRWDENGG